MKLKKEKEMNILKYFKKEDKVLDTEEDLEVVYGDGINPIKFPTDKGIKIWGQKPVQIEGVNKKKKLKREKYNEKTLTH
jgi:hypothetical protein